jgi:hypothetical protein
MMGYFVIFDVHEENLLYSVGFVTRFVEMMQENHLWIRIW